MPYQPDYSSIVQSGRSQGSALMQGLTGLGQMGGDIRQRRAEEEDEKKRKELAAKALAGDSVAQDTLSIEDPKLNEQVLSQLGAIDERTQKGMVHDAVKVLSLHQAGQPEQVINYLDQRIAAINARGGDASHTIQAKEVYAQNPEQGAKLIEGELRGMLSPETFLTDKGEAQKSSPATDLDDFTRDAIEQYALDNDGAVMPPGERNLARKEFKRAQAQEVRETSRAVEGVKTSSKYAQKFFEKANDVNTALYNIDDAIEALKSGAITGPAARKLPSVRNATLKLENAQNRMGLDVVKDVTFGALSEKELDVAKQTAMPTGLQPDEMVNWLVEKRRISQIQLDWVQKAADHFAEGGSLVDWIRQNRANPSTRRLPKGVTEEDINATMQANKMTREQVLARLAGK